MNQRTHAWIAIRAIKLLEDEGSVPELVKLIKPYTKEASIGAWIPDKRDAKLGGAQTQNHVFKIGPYTGPVALNSRFIVDKKHLLKFLGQERLSNKFIDQHGPADNDPWWSKPYKADPPPGKHLANRTMALDINSIDLLILGNPTVQQHVPGTISFTNTMSPKVMTSPGQVALFLFMLSHFIADSFMPCHCDERDLSDYANGLHEELESHWSKKVGTYFDEKSLINSKASVIDILDESKQRDFQFGITFNNVIPTPQAKDIWEEIVLLCRASFTIASIIAPYSIYPYKPSKQVPASFRSLFQTSPKGEALLAELDKVIMHDSILNVAMVWKNIWSKF